MEQVPDKTTLERYFVATLRELVAAESPSADPAAVRACTDLLADLGAQIAGVCSRKITLDDGRPALAWELGDDSSASAGKRVLVLGHVDTVWPAGTAAARPFAYAGDVATGPGVYDMKAGLLVGLFALRLLGPRVPVTFLVTGDEEIGSTGSRSLIEAEAAKAQAVLVLEGAGPGGAFKQARKGWSIYRLTVRGRSAHAGLEPHEGRNALARMAELVPKLTALADPGRGLTVTPTLARAGQTVNTVPDHAELTVDVRAETAADQERIDRAIRALAGPEGDGPEGEGGMADARGGTGGCARVEVDGGVNRPPMERSMSSSLLRRVESCLPGMGLANPGAVAVGGVSDANLTASMGIPTLDGLGAVGGGAHADHEWIDVPATLSRADVLAALISTLVERPEVPDGR